MIGFNLLVLNVIFLMFVGKRYVLLNGKSDKDSGYGEMSDVNIEIEIIMLLGLYSSEKLKEYFEFICLNSDVVVLVNR